VGPQSAGNFDEVVAALYEAAVHPQRWQSALSGLAAWSGTETFHFLRWDSMARSAAFNVYADSVQSSVIESYSSYYWAVAMSTARTHLRAVFDKTYTRRQADLVRLLLLL
jgi:hypothetical protein